MHGRFPVLQVVILLLISVCTSVPAQSWTFAREKEGIRICTRLQENSSFKSFHGEVVFTGDFDKASALVGDPSKLDWWADDVENIQVLYHEKDRQIRYYFEYHVPWPFADRDLVTDVMITQDSVTGTKTVFSTPLPGLVPQKPGLIRVSDYWQKWILQPLDSNQIHITLEGYIDPSGDVPAWLYNIVVVDIPFKLLQEVRAQSEVN